MAKKRRPSKNINAKGRSKYDDSQFVMIPHAVLESPQYLSLKGNDVRVLFEICRRCHGFNNGRIGAGLTDLATKLNMSKSTADRCVKNLQKTKFLIKRKQGRFMGRLASEWEVTFLKSEGYRPKNEWGQAQTIKRKRKPKIKPLEDELFEQMDALKTE